MHFAKAMKQESTWIKTENGADAKNTSGNALLDMYGSMGAMRNRREDDITTMFDDAYKEDPLGATRCMFYLRDVRGGCGERHIFRILLKHVAQHYTEALIKNIGLIGEYGRWDDIYSLVGTPAEDAMWTAVSIQLYADIESVLNGKPCSLLAKWLKNLNCSSKNTRSMARYTAKKLGLTEKQYRQICTSLRKYIDVVEIRMANGTWDTIKYPHVPARAMMIYRNAFKRHDPERFQKYLDDVRGGQERINAATLYPYDIVEKCMFKREKNDVLEALWQNLPDYVQGDFNAVVMADVSGSMYYRPLATSIGLALYFAERNTGPYHNLFMTFSEYPSFVEVKGSTLEEKIRRINSSKWGFNTNLTRAMEEILAVARRNNCSQEDMPKALIIISDMEIDGCVGNEDRRLFYEKMSQRFEAAGYKIPNVIFWNVDSRHDTFHADSESVGVQLVSGQSASIFKNIMAGLDRTPVEAMYAVLNGPRYSRIKI